MAQRADEGEGSPAVSLPLVWWTRSSYDRRRIRVSVPDSADRIGTNSSLVWL